MTDRLTRHSLFWVCARESGQLVGFVNVIGDGGARAILLDARVRPDCQGRGLGALIVQTAADEALRQGCHWLHADYEPHLVTFYEAAHDGELNTAVRTVGSVSAVYVPTVLDAQHDDFAILLVDAVQDSIGSAACGVDADELSAEGFAHSVRVVDEGSGKELDDCRRHRLGKTLRDRPSGWRGEDKFERLRHGRSARTASVPRTTLPSLCARSPSRMSARASGSLSTDKVSSSSARSSALRMTAAALPLRVTVTRSCSRCTRSTTSLK